ncbi:MAG: conjugative transposon protein TraM [Dysgonamonadaceae bacterium]|jgi:conjugative transposon TraM protein|nr:conjugative transposon protein TraM [Dysgonamonadaceae bacterium]
MNLSNTIDKKKLLLMLVPVVVMGVLIILFFGLGKNKGETNSMGKDIFEPESVEETQKDKVSAYDQDRKNFSSRIRGSEFYTDIRNRDAEEYERRANQMKKNIYKDMLETDGEETFFPDSSSGSVSLQFRANIEQTSREQTVENILREAVQRGELEQHIADNERLRNEIAKKYGLPASDPDGFMGQSSDTEPVQTGRVQPEVISTEELAEALPEKDTGTFIIEEDGTRRRRPRNVMPLQNNLIKACVHGDQTLVSGGIARLRLLEKIQINGITVPHNTIIYGVVGIGSNRLRIIIENMRVDENILPVSFIIYDNDGMEGLNLPNNLKAEAKRQMERGMLTGIQLPLSSIGTVTSEITSAVNATTQAVRMVLSSSISLIKVDLKANYRLYIQEETREDKRNREEQEKKDVDSLMQNLQEPQKGSQLELLLNSLY